MQYGDLVSVIVPAYNRAHIIGRALDSLCHQTYPSVEILVVDDASADETQEVVQARNDPRIRYIRHDHNRGAGAARNTGVAQAIGELISFHDSDDICLFDKIEYQMRAMIDLPEDYIGTYCMRLFYNQVNLENYRSINIYFKPNVREHDLDGDLWQKTCENNIINLPTLLIRKQAFIDSGGFDERLRNNEDWDFCLRLTKMGRVHFQPIPLFITPQPLDIKHAQHRISRTKKYHARSFVYITGKLRRQGVRSKALGRHYAKTADFLFREGRLGFARRYLCAAIALDTFNLRHHVQFLLTASQPMYLFIKRLKRRMRGDRRG
jgi:glycosyltransferase involved in cell wall biosynthesis